MAKTAEVLSPSVNFAIVQLPERNFPGVVFQGDSLHSIYMRFKDMIELLNRKNFDELNEELEDIHEHFAEILAYYEKVCFENGISLPYSRKSATDV